MQEGCHRVIRGPRFDLLRGTYLAQHAAYDDCDAMTDRGRLAQIVCNKDSRTMIPLQDHGQIIEQLCMSGRVERCERLVQQQQLGLQDKCPRQGNPLCLSPG